MSEDFELTAEELEEERQDAAVRIIQRAARGRRALLLLKRLIRANYVKIRDPEFENGFLYKNRATGEVRSDKPAFLGEEDLPDPREFKAPFGYDPGSVEDFGCALIATIADYKDPKITNLSPGFIGEHHRFESLLTHDFKCRIMEESVVSLLNPTASEFVDGLERLRRMGRPTGFTFIYICSHVATVGGSGAYVCCRDTDWRNADSVKRTAVSLARLCTLINALPGARKAIALSIAHPSNPPKRFSSGLKLYPPKGFYCDLADKCGCAVLGSCNIGSTVRQHLMHTYPLPPKERESAVLRALRKSQKTAVRAGKGHAQEDPGSSSGEEESDEYEVEEDCRTVGPTGPIKYRRYRHHDMCPAVVLRQLELLKRRKEDRTKRDSVVIREPHPAWQRHEEHGFVVVTPHPREHRKYYWRKKWERFVNGVRPHLDRWSDSRLEAEWLTRDTPRQYSFADEGGSAFMQAVVKALDGGIDYSGQVTAELGNASVGVVKVSEVFMKTRESMKGFFRDLNTLKRLDVEQQLSIASLNRKVAEKDDERDALKQKEIAELDADFAGKQGVEIADEDKKKQDKKKKRKKKELEQAVVVPVFRELPPQDPVLFLPHGVLRAEDAASYPLCFRPSPPPPPDKPFAIKVGETFVLLEWEQAEFDGVAVTKYDVYIKNETRLYSNWKLAPNASNVPSGGLYTRFTVNHLPIGIRTEFRVVGYNSVGRSLPSKASVRITPGENLVPVGSEHRWRRLAHGGSMAVLDHMEHYIQYRNEVLRGFRLLVAFAQKSQGFARMTTQVRSCRVSLAVLQQYPHDVCCISGALLLIGYSCQGATSSPDSRAYLSICSMVEEYNLSLHIAKYMFEFETVSKFRQAVYWCLKNAVPLPGVAFSVKTVRNIVDTSNEDLFNIFSLNVDEGDVSIEDNGVAAEEDEENSMELIRGSNPMRL